jgi:hypothetical protein
MKPFPELKEIDLSPIDEAMAALENSLSTLKQHKQLDGCDESAMEERFDDYCKAIKPKFAKGFEDGYLTAHYDNEDGAEAYHEGFRDGYTWSQMVDNASGIQGD